MRHLIRYVCGYWALLPLCFSLLSCSEEFNINSYSLSRCDVYNGLVEKGEIVSYPIIQIQISGPEKHSWEIIVSSEKGESVSTTTETGEKVELLLDAFSFSRQEPQKLISVLVKSTETNEILVKKEELEVAVEGDFSPDDQEEYLFVTGVNMAYYDPEIEDIYDIVEHKVIDNTTFQYELIEGQIVMVSFAGLSSLEGVYATYSYSLEKGSTGVQFLEEKMHENKITLHLFMLTTEIGNGILRMTAHGKTKEVTADLYYTVHSEHYYPSMPDVTLNSLSVQAEENTKEIIVEEDGSCSTRLSPDSSGYICLDVSPEDAEIYSVIKLSEESEGLTISPFKRDGSHLLIPYHSEKEGKGVLYIKIDGGENILSLSIAYSIGEEGEEEPAEPHISASTTLSIDEYILINNEIKAEMDLSIEGESEQTLSDTWKLEVTIDDKPVDFSMRLTDNKTSVMSTNGSAQFSPRSGKYQLVFNGAKLSTGQHVLRTMVSAPNIPEREVMLPAYSSIPFCVFDPIGQWFRDADLQDEVYDHQYLFNESPDSRFYLKVSCDGTEERPTNVSVRDMTSGWMLPPAGAGVHILKSPSRGEHRFSVQGEMGETSFSLSLTKIIKDEYRCQISMDNDGIYAVTSGPNGSIADFTTNFTFNAVVRAVIPYTEAIVYAGDCFVQDEYEYENFQWVGTDFIQWNGSQYGQFVLQKGWIQTGLSWAKGKMTNVSARTNGASRWVERGGRMEIEYYTPVPYLEVAVYFKTDMSDGNNLDYALWSFRCENAERWLKENGVSFKGYLL